MRLRRPRVVLAVDRAGRAFDIVAHAFARRLSDRFEFLIVRRDVEPFAQDPGEIDLLYAFWWGDRSFSHLGLPAEKVVREVASHRWEVEERYGRLSPRAFADAFLRDCATVTTPSRRLHGLLAPLHPRVLHVPNGVDTRLFRPRRRSGERLRVGWVGDPADPTKGLGDVLEPACEGAYELLRSSGAQSQRDLVSIYQRADVVAIASLAEGQPLPLMEGMACGCFPVTTDVGIAPELVRTRVNGLLVERTPEAFREALDWCQRNLACVRRAGRFNAELMRAERSWDLLARRFGDVLDAALARGPLPAPEAPAPAGPLRASLQRASLPARVAFVTPEYAGEQTRHGGLGSYVRRMADALAAQGNLAEVFVPSGRSDTSEANGVIVHRVRSALARRPVRAALRALAALRQDALARALVALVDAWLLARALQRRGAAVGFDLVQSADHKAVGLFVSTRGAPHLIRCSNDDRETARQNGQRPGPRALVDALTRLALRRADVLYAPSRFLARHLERRGLRVGVVAPPAFLEVKPAAQPPPGLPARYFVHFGQLTRVKGTGVLTDALPRVLEREPGFAMVWAGRDPLGLVDACRARLGPLGERLLYLGALERPALYALVAGADAAVLPPLFDNLPNCAIESLLLGVPVIATHGTSLDELVEPGVTGTLVPPGNADALADAILRQWRGESGVRRGFAWRRPELQPDAAVAALLALAGIHGAA